MSAAKEKLQLIIKLLLVLALLPVVTTTQSPVDLINAGASPTKILFIPAFARSSVSVFTLDGRTNFDSFNELHTDLWVLRHILVDFSQGSSCLITGYNTCFSPRADRAAIPIRASPCRHKRKSVTNA
jgi:hypothetical protein